MDSQQINIPAELKLDEPASSNDKTLEEKVAFYNNGYERQDEEAYRKFMKAEHIVTEDDEEEVVNEQTEYLEDLKFLSTDAILEGKIIGTHKSSDDLSATPMAKIAYGHQSFTVYIPYYLLFKCDVQKYATPEGTRTVENRIRSMAGAKIRFVVRHIDNSTRIVLADRLEALDLLYYRNWKAKDPKNNNKPKAKAGDLVMATVIGIGHKFVTISALGIDQTLIITTGELNEISWNYITDCRDLFKIGQKVPVRVLSVKDEKVSVAKNQYVLGEAKFSIRQATPNPLEQKWDSLREGDSLMATVTGQNLKNYFVLLEDKYECMCAKPKDAQRQPELGDTGCIVTITLKTIEEKTGRKRLYGRFIKY